MQTLVRSKTLGVTGYGGRGTAGAGPGRDLFYPTRCALRLGAGFAAAPFSFSLTLSKKSWDVTKPPRRSDQGSSRVAALMALPLHCVAPSLMMTPERELLKSFAKSLAKSFVEDLAMQQSCE